MIARNKCKTAVDASLSHRSVIQLVELFIPYSRCSVSSYKLTFVTMLRQVLEPSFGHETVTFVYFLPLNLLLSDFRYILFKLGHFMLSSFPRPLLRFGPTNASFDIYSRFIEQLKKHAELKTGQTLVCHHLYSFAICLQLDTSNLIRQLMRNC